jgi:hypothetical protein
MVNGVPEPKHWWHDIRSVIMLMFTGTICAAFLMTITAWILGGPERVPETVRERFAEYTSLILGMLAGWMMNSQTKRNGPE